MNYFTHALNYLDRPYFMAGTAIPDWLSVVDRKVRFRPQHLVPWIDQSGTVRSELAAGTQQHLLDDAWFHSTRGFVEVTSELTSVFRKHLGVDEGFHCGFLGHVGMELLLDAALIQLYPNRFEEYWRSLAEVDPQEVESLVNQMARKSTSQLALFIELFRREQVLRCYTDNRRLLRRINQVLVRVRLRLLPEKSIEALAECRTIVESSLVRLLPSDQFTMPESPGSSLSIASIGV